MSKFQIGSVVYLKTPDDVPTGYYNYIVGFLSKNVNVGIVRNIDANIGAMRPEAFTEEELENDWTDYEVQFNPAFGEGYYLEVPSKYLDFADIGKMKTSRGNFYSYPEYAVKNNYEWAEKYWPEMFELLNKQIVPIPVNSPYIRLTEDEINELVPKKDEIVSYSFHCKIYYKNKKGEETLFFDNETWVEFKRFHPVDETYVWRDGLISLNVNPKDFNDNYDTAYFPTQFLARGSNDLILDYETKRSLFGNGKLLDDSRHPFIVEMYKEK